MLQDPKAIRHFQKLADGIAELWHRGYRFDDIRLYLDGRSEEHTSELQSLTNLVCRLLLEKKKKKKKQPPPTPPPTTPPPPQ